MSTGDRVFVGDRVVVRYRLAPGAPGDWRGATDATLSDVTGVVVDAGDPLVLTRVAPAALTPADLVRVPADLVTSIRLLSYRAVRNNEIRDVALRAVAAPVTDEVQGWLVRAGAAEEGGVPANTAVPARMGARLDSTTVGAVESWFTAHHLPTIVELPERLVTDATAGTPIGGEFHRLIRVADDGTESDIVTVAAQDTDTGIALRADGFRLHHRVAYRRLG
ncbi:GNAT family N-acetyltransferase, cg3035/Rv0428c family [Gordonia crocea]|uniref:Histone acetyltransferase Rv0428c-like C-terminal domain-containing protein n=1 Tax=Gordonia crocea TaxID=589162 RepID=A0A7M3SVI3_9ACTN|nr:hypothetical protein [Gordonia crocea]GED96657.1 hypothetical protein nbrc107697_06960 [Gordonia crocea]